MVSPSKSHFVLIPSYNSGPMLKRVVESVSKVWLPIHVVVDASTDGSELEIERITLDCPNIHVTVLPKNSGKGGAVLHGLQAGRAAGFTHALVMDGDGQHSVAAVQDFMNRSAQSPSAMILGVPIFGDDAPGERVKGRLIGNWWANLETLWGGIHDSLFGFRVYPVKPTLEILESIRTARRFDFDTELAVRLYWLGVPPVNVAVPVRYPDRTDGGVTHFKYFRDNVLLVYTHARLVLGALVRLPKLIALRRRTL